LLLSHFFENNNLAIDVKKFSNRYEILYEQWIQAQATKSFPYKEFIW